MTTNSQRRFSFADTNQDEIFYQDVVMGLSAEQKYLSSKYFYDAEGDKLFQQIMQSPQYYLTRCEQEIISTQKQEMAQTISSVGGAFDVVELGPGDASKSFHLLEELVTRGITNRYFPIDISASMIMQLETKLPSGIAGLSVTGFHGEYTEMLKETKYHTDKQRLILFMGANIGNFTTSEAKEFCTRLKEQLLPGDLLMIGFDLKKNPKVILDAYNDDEGITRLFNLNLLTRINRELDADFDIAQFEHFPTYDPVTGSCKSYLISLKNQAVHMGEDVKIHFSKYETIYMEISQKYTMDQINMLAYSTGFKPVKNFFDSRGWFANVLWQCSHG